MYLQKKKLALTVVIILLRLDKFLTCHVVLYIVIELQEENEIEEEEEDEIVAEENSELDEIVDEYDEDIMIVEEEEYEDAQAYVDAEYEMDEESIEEKIDSTDDDLAKEELEEEIEDDEDDLEELDEAYEEVRYASGMLAIVLFCCAYTSYKTLVMIFASQRTIISLVSLPRMKNTSMSTLMSLVKILKKSTRN